MANTLEIRLPDRLAFVRDLVQYEDKLYVCADSTKTERGGPPSELVVFDLADGRQVNSIGIDLSLEGRGRCLAIHDPTRLAITGDAKAVIIDPELGQVVSTLDIPEGSYQNGPCIVPERGFIVFGGANITVCDLENGNRIATLGVDNEARIEKYIHEVEDNGERWDLETLGRKLYMEFRFIYYYPNDARLVGITQDGYGVIWKYFESSRTFKEVSRFDVMK